MANTSLQRNLKLASLILGGLVIIFALIIAALSQIKATHESRAQNFGVHYDFLGRDIATANQLILEANAVYRHIVTWQSLNTILKSRGGDQELVTKLEENITILYDELLSRRKQLCMYTEGLKIFKVDDRFFAIFKETQSPTCKQASDSLDKLAKTADDNLSGALKIMPIVAKQIQKERASSSLIGKWITLLALATGICSLLSYIFISSGDYKL